MRKLKYLWLLALFLAGVLLAYLTQPTAQSTAPTSHLEEAFEYPVPEPQPIKCSLIKSDELLIETNKLRKEAGVAPLAYSETLEKSATLKAKHMAKFDYWDHNSPDGVTPWYWFDEVGYGYAERAENLAQLAVSSYATVRGWEASPDHKKAMLQASLREVGFGILYDKEFVDGLPSCIVVGHYGNQL